VDGRRYRLLRLSVAAQAGERLVGALLLSDEVPTTLPWPLVRAMAERLDAAARPSLAAS
jgi:hypothetical protein